MTDTEFYDLDGDGLTDAMMTIGDGAIFYGYDTDGDGVFDSGEAYADANGDGIFDTYTQMLDTDHNGSFDTFLQQADTNGDGYMETLTRMMDYDADGMPDYSHSLIDLDGDGDAEMVVTTHSGPEDSDIADYSEIFVDYDGDHVPDDAMRVERVDSNGNGVPDTARVWRDQSGDGFAGDPEIYTLDQLPPGFMPDHPGGDMLAANFDPSEADPDLVSGTPAESMEHWEFQGDTARCALYAQKFVIHDLTGRDIDIDEMVNVATENGWFVDDTQHGGTMTLNTDKLLDYYGIDHEMQFDSSIEALEEALAEGDGVIVSIDAHQVWSDKPNDIFSPDTASDHMVQVIGIDRTDPEHPMVVLNDSGHPDGRGELVPLEDFEGAWSAGDRQMIICKAPTA